MLDVRFSTALQLLLTMANAARNGFAQVSSETLATGLGTSPSLTRRLLVPLAAADIVRAKLGKHGGVSLAGAASEITLGDIYRAVVGEKPILAGRTDIPHLCDVSSRAEKYFASIAREADDAVIRVLDRRTLAESLDELLALERDTEPPRAQSA